MAKKEIIQTDKLQKALLSSSKLLDLVTEPDLALEQVLIELLSIIGYDKGFVFFMSRNGFTLKHLQEEIKTNFEFLHPNIEKTGLLLKNFIKDKKAVIGNADTSINTVASELGIRAEGDYSYLASPLKIRETLFGMILLVKEGKDNYTQDDIPVMQAFSSSASYAVKDSELGNVFKMQLKILQDNIVQKADALNVIKEQNEKILEADRVKNEFLANISHELRTPLNAIIGFSDALKLELFGKLNEKQKEYVTDINASGIHLLGMINEILDISKIEAKEMNFCKSNFDSIVCINEVINIIKALADKKNIELVKNFEKTSIPISADYQKLQQIMYNLLSNAVKFTPRDGKIEIGASITRNNLKVYVKDTGVGIDKKYHGKIFAKFQQIDSTYTKKESSTGLGLTITKEFVEMHGGGIWIESKLNEGTIFTFEIPTK